MSQSFVRCKKLQRKVSIGNFSQPVCLITVHMFYQTPAPKISALSSPDQTQYTNYQKSIT